MLKMLMLMLKIRAKKPKWIFELELDTKLFGTKNNLN